MHSYLSKKCKCGLNGLFQELIVDFVPPPPRSDINTYYDDALS